MVMRLKNWFLSVSVDFINIFATKHFLGQEQLLVVDQYTLLVECNLHGNISLCLFTMYKYFYVCVQMCVNGKCTKKIKYGKFMLHLNTVSQTKIHHRVNLIITYIQKILKCTSELITDMQFLL